MILWLAVLTVVASYVLARVVDDARLPPLMSRAVIGACVYVIAFFIWLPLGYVTSSWLPSWLTRNVDLFIYGPPIIVAIPVAEFLPLRRGARAAKPRLHSRTFPIAVATVAVLLALIGQLSKLTVVARAGVLGVIVVPAFLAWLLLATVYRASAVNSSGPPSALVARSMIVAAAWTVFAAVLGYAIVPMVAAIAVHR